MVTFEQEDDNISPENLGDSFDGSDFSEAREFYSNKLGLLEDEKDNSQIDDHINTPVFASKLDAKNWCVGTGKKHNCAIVSKPGSVRKRNFWTTGKGCRYELQCERSGVHRSHKSKKEAPVTTSKRKRDCFVD
ncbi:hypothetical protein MKX01_022238 [Papaver californicum]|nr:hypothetical protein MKX01_022238 [Papaver californicum]